MIECCSFIYLNCPIETGENLVSLWVKNKKPER